MRINPIIPICMLLLSACSNPTTTPNAKQTKARAASPQSLAREIDLVENSQPIDIDSANKMLTSYLTSIDYTHNDTDLHSLIVNADTLRSYLRNEDIKYVKLMFAHTLDYINTGNENKNVGYGSNKLTIVIVGYNDKNEYIYNAQGRVYDNCMPCPIHCPKDGSAAADLLPTAQ